MRIHIEIPPSLLSPFSPPAGEEADDDGNGPIFARIGGNIVLLELQGTLQAEGDKDGQLIGKLGMEGVSACVSYIYICTRLQRPLW